jgi:hypothetical protein
MADNSWKFYKYSDYTNDYVKCSMSSNELRICGLLFKGGASHFFKNGIDELIVYIMQNDRLEDLSFCKGLPIVSLCVWSCDKLVDISVLNELPLKNIELSHLNICDISALDGLPLKQLKIEKCPVKDIEVLKNCHTLCRVTLKNVPVVEFDALNGLKLDTVVLDGTRGRDLSSFLKIESLKYFNVGCGKIRCVDCE